MSTVSADEIPLVEGERLIITEDGYYYELKLENTTIHYSQEFRDSLFALPEDYFNNLEIKKIEDKIKPKMSFKSSFRADGTLKRRSL